MQDSANASTPPAAAYVGIGQIKPLGSAIGVPVSGGGCGSQGGEGKASCGSSGGPDDMPPEIWEKVKNHPCYSEEAHHHYARMHVAVAPACNIQCNYCNRKYDCSNESRPGVVSQKLTPEQALRYAMSVPGVTIRTTSRRTRRFGVGGSSCSASATIRCWATSLAR